MNMLQLGMGWFPEQAGGLNRFYYDLTNQLYLDGVGIYGLVAGTNTVIKNSQGLVNTFSSSNGNLIKRWIKMRRTTAALLNEKDFDLVTSHFALYTFPVLDKLRKIPLVVHFQGPWADECAVEGQGRYVSQLKSHIERSVYTRAMRCIVLSKAFGKILANRYGVDESLIRVIPGGVNVERFAITESPTNARLKLGWPIDRPTILVVRRLAKRMGLENLVEAVAEVKRHIPEVLVLIAGKGPIHQGLEKLIAERDVSENVRLLGFVPDEQLPLAYRAADFTLVPTIALEGFGLITLESLASGTPVLVTPVGGLPETVEGLSDNLILPGASDKVLASGIRSALDGSLPLPDAKSCVAYVKENFNWPLIAKRILGVYEEALA